MKQFLLGVVTGVVCDRVFANSVSNGEIVAEMRKTLKKLDDALAAQTVANDFPPVPEAPPAA